MSLQNLFPHTHLYVNTKEIPKYDFNAPHRLSGGLIASILSITAQLTLKFQAHLNLPSPDNFRFDFFSEPKLLRPVLTEIYWLVPFWQ